MGSGKGYLSQHLALGHRLCVVGIDAQVSNTQGAITRNEKVPRTIIINQKWQLSANLVFAASQCEHFIL